LLRLLVTANVVPSWPIFVTLITVAITSSEMSVLTITMRLSIPKVSILRFYNNFVCISLTVSVVSWSEFLAADTEVPGSIIGATRFYEYQWFWIEVHSAS
jgi:hypothetical protein